VLDEPSGLRCDLDLSLAAPISAVTQYRKPVVMVLAGAFAANARAGLRVKVKL
jgi:hypothetical protein